MAEGGLMGAHSEIQWTQATWNPVTGCSKVSPGCAHCYAESFTRRMSSVWRVPDLPWTPENAERNVILHPKRLDQPLHWRKPRLIFVNSMSDLFHELVPDEFIADAFAVMSLAHRHTFQVLTKRPERMRALLNRKEFRGLVDDAVCDRQLGSLTASWPLRNVWLGTSIENRRFVDRALELAETPAAVRFISAEPLLGPLVAESVNVSGDDGTVTTWRDDYTGPMLPFYGDSARRAFDWMIVGGESGDGFRPMDLDWVRDLRDTCVHEGVAFFYKQAGGRTPKSGTRLLDGRTWDEMPAGADPPAERSECLSSPSNASKSAASSSPEGTP